MLVCSFRLSAYSFGCAGHLRCRVVRWAEASGRQQQNSHGWEGPTLATHRLKSSGLWLEACTLRRSLERSGKNMRTQSATPRCEAGIWSHRSLPPFALSQLRRGGAISVSSCRRPKAGALQQSTLRDPTERVASRPQSPHLAESPLVPLGALRRQNVSPKGTTTKMCPRVSGVRRTRFDLGSS